MGKMFTRVVAVILAVNLAIPLPYAASPQSGIAHAEGSDAAPQWTEVESVNVNVYGDPINGSMLASEMTPDGRYVVLASSATNLDSRADAGDIHIYVRDRLTDQIELVDVNASGLAANSSGQHPSISDDGRYVVFQSLATNLVAETSGIDADSPGNFDRVYRVDRTTGSVELVSVSTADVAADGASESPEISGDGQFVVFQSEAGNLTDDSTASRDQIYIRDLTGHTTSMVSHEFTDGSSREPSVSADGQVVAFTTAQNSGTEWAYHIYRYDVSTDTATMVTARTDASYDGEHRHPVVSADGSRIVFASKASNLVAGDANGKQDIFLYDNGTLSRVSVDDAGGESDGDSFSPDISPDGNRIAFESEALLVDGMQYDSPDSSKTIYIYDIAAGQLANVGGIEHAYDGAEPSLAGDALAYVDDTVANVVMNRTDMPVWPDHSSLSLDYMDSTKLELSWNDIGDPDVQLYKLYKTTFEGGSGMKTRLIGTTTGTSMTVDGLTPIEIAHSVTYRVEAVNGLYHTSQDGPPMTIDANPGGPGDTEIPTWTDGSAIHVDSTQADRVALSWPDADDNAGVNVYWIYMDDPGTAGHDYLPVLSTSATSAVIEGLTPDSSYSFYVTAMDAAGNESDPLPAVEAVTLPASELVVDGQLTAEPQEDGSVELGWSTDDRVTTYEIWDVTDAAHPAKLAEASDVAFYTLTGLEASTAYRLKVVGYFGPVDEHADYESNVVQVNTSSATISGVTLSTSHITGGVAELGSAETVTLTGQPGRTAIVQAAFLTWYDTDGTTVLETPREASQIISMEENSTYPGTYTGTFTFAEGMTRLIKLEGRLTDALGHESPTVAAADLPVDAAAGLRVSVTGNGNLQNYRINAFSPSLLASQSKASDGETVALDRLPAASDYHIRVLSSSGKMIKEVTGIELKSGWISDEEIPVNTKQLSFTVTTGGNTVNGQTIALFYEDGSVMRTLATDSTGATPAMEFSADTEAVTARLSNLPVRFVDPGEIKVELHEDVVNQAIPLTERKKGRIRGTVTRPGGEPLSGALIQISQTLNDSIYTTSTTTDLSGKYDLEAYEGEAEATFSAPLLNGVKGVTETVAVQASAPQIVDKQLEFQGMQALTINLYTRYAGEQEWQGPLPIDWTTGLHLDIKADGQNVVGNTTILSREPGEKVVVSANGEEGGLGQDTEEVTLEEDGDTEVDLHLEQADTQIIRAQLQYPVEWHGYTPLWSASLFKWNGSYWKSLLNDHGSGDSIELATVETGRMKLTVGGQQGRVEIEFDKPGGRDLDLGVLQLRSGDGAFGDTYGNHLSAFPVELAPDGFTTIQVRYRSGVNAENARMIVAIPDGMTFVEQSLALNGVSVPYTLQGSSVAVGLGSLPPAASGALTFRLKALPEAADALWVNAQMAYETDGQPRFETIGTVQLIHEPITIQAPEFTNRLEWTLSGKAPAGQAVTIYSAGQPLGRTLATPGGLWNLDVTIPDPSGAQLFRLHAESGEGGMAVRSPEAAVHYDPEMPVIEEFTMQQERGRRVSLDVSKGPVRFPYVVVPSAWPTWGPPLHFEIRFNHPDRVENVQVHLKGDDVASPSRAELKDGIYYAQMPVPFHMSENVYVTFDRKPAPPPQIETSDDLVRELPPGMRDYQVVDKQDFQSIDANTLAGSMEFTLPQAHDLKLHVNMTLERNTGYVPTEDDLKQAAELGVEAYGVHVVSSEENGQYVTTIEAYVPEESLGDANTLFALLSPAAGENKQAKRKPVRIAGILSSLVKITAKVLWDEKNVAGQLGKGHLSIDDAKSAMNGRGDIADKMNRLGYMAERIGTCSPGTAGYYGKRIEGMVFQTRVVEFAKYGLMIAGLVLSPATFGGSLALTAATMAIGAGMDAVIDHQTNELQDAIDRASRSSNNKCSPHVKKDLGDPLVKPVWIYDPSGFVYETFPDNPIEDVKATVFYRDETSGQYAPWKADWYGQTNPQMTDALGKYGWDVPSGRWQVVYEKEGYETAKSEEMDVPPPHFDVNVPMVSYVSPQVTGAKAQTSAEGLTIDFTTDKYIASDRLASDGIVVSSGGTPLAGTLIAVNSRVDDGGHALTRTFRFSSDQAVSVGAALGVTLRAGAVVSYAGVEMEQDYTRTDLQALEKDIAAPAVSDATTNASGNIITIAFDEPLDTARTISAEKVALSGAPWPIVGIGYGPDGKTVEAALAGNVQKADSLSVHIAGNTVSDLNGNWLGEQDVAVRNQAVSVDASLSGLRVSGYSLSPRFQPGVEVYSVRVPEGVDSLSVTATASSDQAAVRVNGTAVHSGEAYEAAIVDETIVIALTAADGYTKGFYEIDVVRGQPGGSSSPGIFANAGNTSTTGDLFIPAGGTGTVSLDDRVRVDVPEGALPQAFRIQVAEVEAAEYADGAAQQLVRLGPVYEMTKDVAGKFNHPVTITMKITFDPELYPDAAIYYYDEAKRQWVKIGGTIEGDAITVTVDHFTKFSVFAAEEDYAQPVELLDIQGHWAESSIREAVKRGFVSGYPDQTFQPDKAVTRAEFVTMLVRALNMETADDALTFRDASDIPAWAKPYIAQAVSAGMVQGYEDQTFRPDRMITREELVVVIAKALGLSADASATTSYADDARISTWAKPFVASATAAGLIAGRENHLFSPAAPATRAEAVTVLIGVVHLGTVLGESHGR